MQLASFARRIHGEDELDQLLDLVSHARIVVFGTATYGTHEHFDLRASLTRKLIAERGFVAVAIEADWADVLDVDRYVRHRADTFETAFERFPASVWSNEDVVRFVDWLRYLNLGRGSSQRAGFYGLDIYGLHAAIRAARLHDDADDELIAELVDMHARRVARAGRMPSGGAWFGAMQAARLAGRAEPYYRTLLGCDDAAWNVRSTHLADTVDMLASVLGDPARLVVWAHDAHAGDARAHGGERRSLGQLLRERYPGEVALVGFTTYDGTVACAPAWDTPPEVVRLPPCREDSWEKLFHEIAIPRFMITAAALRRAVGDGACRSRRVIDVVARPDPYYDTRLAMQYDVIVHVDTTRAVEPVITPRTVESITG